jgi:hypothetical protein
MDEAQLQALIDQRVAERTRELEAKLDQVAKNRDSILREERELEGRDESARLMRAADRILNPPKPDIGQPSDRILIPRGTSPAEYQRLKALAAERGVPYFVGDERSDPALANTARGETSRVKFVEDERTLWANQEMQRQVGIVELSRRAAVAGKRLRIFRSADELEPEARARHDRILQDAEPDKLVHDAS